MAIKLEENAKLEEVMSTLESVENDLQAGKTNIANILGSPFTGNDRLDITKNTLSSIRSTFVSNLSKKGVSTIVNTPFEVLAENIDKIEQGSREVPTWYSPKNFIINGAYDPNIKTTNYCTYINKNIYFIVYSSQYNVFFKLYNTITNTFTSLSMSEFCEGFLLVNYNEEIYRVGGKSGSQIVTNVQKYNTKTATWSFVPNMITPRYSICGEVYNDEIHVLYGTSSLGKSRVSEYFKVSTNTWTTKGELLYTKYTEAKCIKTLNTFFLNGLSDPGDIYDAILATYNPVLGIVTNIDGISYSFSVSIKNYVYLGTYDTVGRKNKCSVYNESGKKESYRDLGEIKIPTGVGTNAVSIDDKFIYYCESGYVKCFIPELYLN